MIKEANIDNKNLTSGRAKIDKLELPNILIHQYLMIPNVVYGMVMLRIAVVFKKVHILIFFLKIKK